MKDYWLKPNGQLIEVPDQGHNDYASDLLEKEMGLCEMLDYIEENGMDYPYEVLHKRGWVRIKHNTSYLPKVEVLGNCISLVKQMKNTMCPAMNKVQMKVALKLCDGDEDQLNKALNDKRFW